MNGVSKPYKKYIIDGYTLRECGPGSGAAAVLVVPTGVRQLPTHGVATCIVNGLCGRPVQNTFGLADISDCGTVSVTNGDTRRVA